VQQVDAVEHENDAREMLRRDVHPLDKRVGVVALRRSSRSLRRRHYRRAATAGTALYIVGGAADADLRGGVELVLVAVLVGQRVERLCCLGGRSTLASTPSALRDAARQQRNDARQAAAGRRAAEKVLEQQRATRRQQRRIVVLLAPAQHPVGEQRALAAAALARDEEHVLSARLARIVGLVGKHIERLKVAIVDDKRAHALVGKHVLRVELLGERLAQCD
jgi:hypothetical protein